MKKILISLCVVLICLVFGSSVDAQPGKITPFKSAKIYDKEWKKVDSLVEKDLPKSALEVVNKIYISAKADNKAAQFVKTVMYQLRLESETEENYSVKAIEKLKLETETAKFPVSSVLRSMLAELYKSYYEQNRYKILGRSVTVDFKDNDISTWDVKKIVQEINNNYLLSLKDASELKKTEVNVYDAVIEKGENSRKFRPTLYDFLAHRAIDYFMNEEAYITVPAYKYEIDQPVYFSTAEEFIKYKIISQDSMSLKLYAMRLLQDIEAFHLDDKTLDALVDAELKRLDFARNNSVDDLKDSLYLNALLVMKKRYESSEVCADVIYQIAEEYSKDSLRTAVEYCNEAIKKFPATDGANNCKVLKENISMTSLSVNNEYGNLPDKPFKGLLTYKNINKVYFRVIKLEREEDRKLQERYYGKELIEKYLKLAATKEWELSLPDDGDYHEHKAEFKLPELGFGYYALLVGTDKSFSTEKQTATYSNFWITNISYITRIREKGLLDFYILNRETGSPMKDVDVQLYYRDYDYGSRTYKSTFWKTIKTSEEGYVEMPTAGSSGFRGSITAEFKYGKDMFATMNSVESYYFYGEDRKKELKTYFFTDRAIYRPGQTIYFKGILIETDGKTSEIKPNETTKVEFYDANYKIISRLELKSNEYGSISGTFTAPVGVMNGQMQITNKSGTAYVTVEEYKRPKFEVVFAPVKGSYRLGETLSLKGNAKAYAGNNIDNAQVKYRVVRRARFPYFYDWGWRPYFPRTAEMEIKNGVTTTDANGEYTIEFNAKPDRTISKKSKPVFDFVVYADVTDINSETHSSSESVSVGYTSLLINADIPEKVDKTEKNVFKFSITNLNGQPEKVEGTINIYQLKQPETVYRERKWDKPDRFTMSKEEYKKLFSNDVYDNENNQTLWDKLKTQFTRKFDTRSDSVIKPEMMDSWNDGTYMIEIFTIDKFGVKVEKQAYFTVYSSKTDKMPDWSGDFFVMIKDKAEPGEKAKFIIGSKDKDVKVVYEIQNQNKIVSRQWLKLSDSKQIIEIPVKEEYRGNFSVQLAFVKHNRSYLHSEIIAVPYTNKQIDISFETFRNKLLPGQEEEWKVTLKDKKGEKVAGEMLAAMYDASLDAFKSNAWSFNIYESYYNVMNWDAENSFGMMSGQGYTESSKYKVSSFKLRNYDILNWFGMNLFGYYGYGRGKMMGGGMMRTMSVMSNEKIQNEANEDIPITWGPPRNKSVTNIEKSKPTQQITKDEKPTEPEVQVRKNFNETAFFYPQLETNDKGEIVIKFTIPEALTRWKLMCLAHTKDLKAGQTIKNLVTQKELMITSNPPRFLREGDILYFPAKISNLSDKDMEGSAELKLFDAVTMKPLEVLMTSSQTSIAFSAKKGQSAGLSWKISIPEGVGAITYRVTAKAGNFSDGEEMPLPVLTNRMLVTESMPMPIRGKQTKQFILDKLLNPAKSSTLKSFRLTLEFTSNPAWYAVQALPYMMETTYESSEALFDRYYANTIASFLMNSNPKIKRVFDMWKNYQPDALLSNLEKNQELKSVLLQETPWVMEAQNETERKQRIGVLFDLNRMSNEQAVSLNKLRKLQTSNGGFSWFAGMPDSRYFTQEIITGFGHLRKLTNFKMQVNNDEFTTMLNRAVMYCDDRVREDYEEIKRLYPKEMDKQHISSDEIQYLYARSYFDKDFRMADGNKEAFNYFKEQASKYRTSFNTYLQGMIAFAMHRYGDDKTANDIIKSLKEKSIHSDEMGMYWKEMYEGCYWYQSGVETQSLLIELFDEVAGDKQSVEDMKVWLLKQKQTQDWKTGRATADACYALLLRGTDILANDKLVDITIGTQKIEPSKLDNTQPEAGTGYFKTSWTGADIKQDMGKVIVIKTDDGVAWGGLYWQYFERLDKITPNQSPLSINKKLFIERNTATGPVIEPISEKSAIKVGDKVKVRVEIRVDRNLEYVHLKDMRAAGFEPVSTLSSYKYQGGLWYYESTLDAATNFFIPYFNKGTYVFEYTLLAAQSGDFSNGVTSIQSLYAPEFGAHSEGIRVNIIK